MNAGRAIEGEPAVESTTRRGRAAIAANSVSLFMRSCPALAGIGSLNHQPPERATARINATPANNRARTPGGRCGRDRVRADRRSASMPFVGLRAPRRTTSPARTASNAARPRACPSHRQVDTLQAQRVQEPARVARDERAIHATRGIVCQPALGQSLRAVPNERAALEQRRDERMPLEALERVVRIEQRILVVETRHEAERIRLPGMPVDERAAELAQAKRVAHRVDDAAGRRNGRSAPPTIP